MKRKLFLGLASLVIMAVAVCVTVSSVNANATESDLLSKNIEALSQGESRYFYCSGRPVPLVCVWTADGQPYDSGYQVWL